jgi:hypothetical protein
VVRLGGHCDGVGDVVGGRARCGGAGVFEAVAGTADPPERAERAGEYADWLIAFYDRWAAQGRPVGIRTFDSILSALRGGESFTEALGLEPVTLAVIETDGS